MRDPIYFASNRGPQRYRCLSNMSPHSIQTDRGLTFENAEIAFHWSKFYRSDPQHAAKIPTLRDPFAARRLGVRGGGGKLDPEWELVGHAGRRRKVTIMLAILQLKLAQHTDVRIALRSSSTSPLIHRAPWDAFWGDGKDGTGKNMLGVLWEGLRETIR